MLKRLSVLFVLAALVVGVFSVATAQDATVTVGPITKRVLDRGILTKHMGVFCVQQTNKITTPDSGVFNLQIGARTD